MAVNDVYSVDLYSHAHDKQFVNTFVYRESTEDTGPFPAAALAVEFGINLIPLLRPMLAPDVNIGCTKTHKFVGVAGPTSVAYFVDEFGMATGESLPGNIGLRINLNGSIHGRSSRGALIIGGTPEDEIITGKFNSGWLASTVTPFLDALQIPLVGTGPSTGFWRFGYMSRAPVVLPGPLVAWPGEFVEPDSLSANPLPVVIRRRQTTHTGSIGS